MYVPRPRLHILHSLPGIHSDCAQSVDAGISRDDMVRDGAVGDLHAIGGPPVLIPSRADSGRSSVIRSSITFTCSRGAPFSTRSDFSLRCFDTRRSTRLARATSRYSGFSALNSSSGRRSFLRPFNSASASLIRFRLE